MKHALTRRDFGLGAAASGAVLAGGGRVTRVRAADRPIKIGSLLPRSGYLALIGESCQRGVELAKKMLPEMGYGSRDRRCRHQSKPEVARTQAEKLIRDGAQILVGAFDSGQSFAIAQVAEQNGIPFVVNIGADPAITEQGYKYVFRNFPTSVMLGSHGRLRRASTISSRRRTPIPRRRCC